MKKRALLLLTTTFLMFSFTACTGDAIGEQETPTDVQEEIIVGESAVENTSVPEPTSAPESKENVSEVVPSDTPEPTPEPTPEIKEGEFVQKAPMRIANSYDADIVALQNKELSSWWGSTKRECITFPSTKDPSGEQCKEIVSEDEFIQYIKSYNDILRKDTDIWSASQTDFSFQSGMNSLHWQSQDDIHYYIVESDAFRTGESLRVDSQRIFYDEDTDTLYMYLVYDEDYESFVAKESKEYAITLDEITCSNRMIMALEFDHPDRMPVKEIVLVKPTGMERVSYGANEGKCAEIPSKVMSKIETEDYADFLGNHLLSYEEYERFCTKYGVKKLYDNTTHKYAVIVGTQNGKYGKFAIEKVVYDDELLYVSVLSPGTDSESNKEFGYIIVIPCFDYTNSVSAVINF